MKQITYFAVALNSRGQIEQLIVTRENGKQIKQEWTGVIYRNAASARAEMLSLNCGVRS